MSRSPDGGAGASQDRKSGVSRKRFLQQSAAAAAGVAVVSGGTAARTTAAPSARKAPPGSPIALPLRTNLVVFMTDQERAIQHFPKGWSERNLPGLSALQSNGVTFTSAFTNACMCSPARSTFMSGLFPAQHGVKYTLEENMPAPAYPQVELPLPSRIANLATVMSSAGYNVVYKGKWHCSKPAGALWAPSDLAAYGFDRWNPKDAGANQSLPEAGGGTAQNDARYMSSTGGADSGAEGVLQFVTSQAAAEEPFCLIVSLVNPHDVLLYPRNASAAGYSANWLDGDIDLPETVNEDLRRKPRAQEAFLRIFDLSGVLDTPRKKRSYLNFYGNLMKASDQYLVNLLAALGSVNSSKGGTLLDSTLVVRTSDHGEMGLTHGGMRQKNFTMYDEAINVPLVFSNPNLFPNPRVSEALVSHVDFLPTIASLFGAPAPTTNAFAGVDYSANVLDAKARPPQEYTIFTYDDFQAGQPSGPYVPPPQHIVSFRERRWKFGRYFDPAGTVESELEMYDLIEDPLETTNLARPGYRRSKEQRRELVRLTERLDEIVTGRLAPLATG